MKWKGRESNVYENGSRECELNEARSNEPSIFVTVHTEANVVFMKLNLYWKYRHRRRRRMGSI